MKMKKLLAALLVFCMVLSFAACSKYDTSKKDKSNKTTQTDPTVTDPTQTDPETSTPDVTDPEDTPPTKDSITPLLYKVTDGDGNTIWLFGSIHVGEDYFYPLPDYVTSAYESADALAVEVDIVTFQNDLNAQMDSLRQLVYRDGTKISDHISEDLYNSAVDALKDLGIYNVALDYYYPVLWQNFIESSLYEQLGFQSDLGIDLHFLTRAHDECKKIIEVESAKFQYGMMADFSEELQVLLLESAMESYNDAEGTEESFYELVVAWTEGDEKAFAALLAEAPEFESDEEVALYKEYNDAMVVNRNITMTDFAEDALKSGEEVFICVGAAHIVGEGAMAQLLAERGYTVEIVGK